MFDFIARPFGVVMEFIYTNLAFHNYGLAIIIFTLFVKILLLPLNVKQQKSMTKQQALAPELEAIKNKYKGDNKRIQEEQMNLYSKYKINPYSGCLPTLLQFPLIIIIYQIIRQPLTYIAQLGKEVISKLYTVAENVKDEIGLNTHFMNMSAEEFAKAEVGFEQSQLINMKFLGIFDLGVTPKWQFWDFGDQWKIYLPLFFIPLLAVASSYLQMWITNRINNGPKKKKDGENKPAMPGMQGVLKFMPLITLFIGFIVPAGLGFYWIVSNIFGVLQTILIKKLLTIKNKEGSV